MMTLEEYLMQIAQFMSGSGQQSKSIAPNINIQASESQRRYTPQEMKFLESPGMMDLQIPQLPSYSEAAPNQYASAPEDLPKDKSVEDILMSARTGGEDVSMPEAGDSTSAPSYGPPSPLAPPSAPADVPYDLKDGEIIIPKGQGGIEDDFYKRLSHASAIFGKPIKITSGKQGRPTRPGSMHPRGKAVDIDMSGMDNKERGRLHDSLKEAGILRFGTYDNHPNMLHVDMSDAQGGNWYMHNTTNSQMDKAPQWIRDRASGEMSPIEFSARERTRVSVPLDTSNKGYYKAALPPRGESVLDQILGKYDRGDFKPSETGYEKTDEPWFQTIFGGTRIGRAWDTKRQEIKDRELREWIADELPPYLRDIWRYNPQYALELAKYKHADDVRHDNRAWEAASKDVSAQQRMAEKEAERHVKLQTEGTGSSYADLSSSGKDWMMYKQILATEGPEMAKMFWDKVVSQRDPDWNRRFQEAGAEGKAFPQDLRDTYGRAMEYDRVVQDSLQTQNIIAKVYDLSGASSWEQLGFWIKGGDANQLRALGDVLKGRIAVDKLMEMKRNSANGAAGFGQLTEKELILLQNYIDAINLDAPTEELRKTLTEVLNQYQKVQVDAERGYKDMATWYNFYNNSENLKRPLPMTLDENKFDAYDPWKNIERTDRFLKGRQRQGVQRPEEKPITRSWND